MKLLPLLSISLLFITCSPSNQPGTKSISYNSGEPYDYEEFGTHWYDGNAELTGYTLQQARYGEIHTGEATLIFVTEDFSDTKQVKIDRPNAERSDQVNVLKLNFSKKFITGIYPYSMMLSSFSPLKDGKSHPPLKITVGSQDWCGQSFVQLNRIGSEYQVNSYSYFESEGDQSFNSGTLLSEDGLWTQIRLNPDALPIGEQNIIPGIFYQRLRHAKNPVQKALLSLTEASASEYSDQAHRIYEIDYPDTQRNLKIYFEKEFPFGILGWEETTLSGFGNNARALTTKAKRNATIRSPYWNQNRNEDRALRAQLGLPIE